MEAKSHIPLGATFLKDGQCAFCVWAPMVEHVSVHIVYPHDRIAALTKTFDGYHVGALSDVNPGDLYFYSLDGQKERPDPASRSQPQGVHGPSAVTRSDFAWKDASWHGIGLSELIIYELHVGAFSPAGDFEGIIPFLDYFQDLGITAIELMPVAQFPGSRNWGYDGVSPYAVQNSYGGPEALKKLVNACHLRNIAVALDVVYNHLGPEGNYLWDFGPYFTDRYKTPWGPAVNFDGPHSDHVRRFFIENALYWITEFHIDALRLDAVHGIYDFSARHCLEELAAAVHDRAEELNRPIYIIPESDLNDSRLIRPRRSGGYGLDAQWNDDFHHALHTLLTGERSGYYEDFGGMRQMGKAFCEGFVYSGEYSRFRKRRHGNCSWDISLSRFVVFAQNHDQVGNRALSERLTRLVSAEALKLAAGMTLLSPCVPLLFMGEEYGETAPFPYFMSHSDADLVEAVRRGRLEEFKSFGWFGEPPDPQDESTFMAAKLDHGLRRKEPHRTIHLFYKELIALRKKFDFFDEETEGRPECLCWESEKVLLIKRRNAVAEIAAVYHFGAVETPVILPFTAGVWTKKLDSTELRWGGPEGSVPQEFHSSGETSLTLSPYAVLVFLRYEES
jgi:maltooligosyltrehalose trehalohydrolase